MKKIFLYIVSIIILITGIVLIYPIVYDLSNQARLRLGMSLFVFFFFFLIILVIYSFSQNQNIKKLENRLEIWQKLTYHVNQVGDELFNQLPIGIIALDDDNDIKWANPTIKMIFSNKIINKPLKDISQYLDSKIKEKNKFSFEYANEVYEVWYKQEFNFLYFFTKTEQYKLQKKYHNNLPCIILMSLDNLEESLLNLSVSEQSLLKGQYFSTIADWSSKYSSYLQQVSEDKLIALTKRENLEKMIDEKFNILEKIRQISIKNNLRVSLSMGISSWDSSFESQGVYSKNALDLAEKRGGDQAVVNVENKKIQYFGAIQDAQVKSSRIDARIKAESLKQKLDFCDQVIIVGHKNADLDAIGSMFGMYEMASAIQKNTYLYMPENHLDQTAKKVLEELKHDIGNLRIIENKITNITDKTIVILCDTQSKNLVMDKNLILSKDRMVVIDHHRANDDSIEADLNYIEPYASSTAELVSEIMNFFNQSVTINVRPEVSTVMYSGIVVDTNNFTIRTGPRTFEAAARLKEAGADTQKVNRWMSQELSRLKLINKMLEKATIEEKEFLILENNDKVVDRVLLAKASNYGLLVENIEVVFAIGLLPDNKIHVSARSKGKINVQIFMESLGGGGHLSSAATQIADMKLSEVKEKIISKIKLEYGKEVESMKIILLEDIKGRGRKDEVIEVAGGFGQYLLNQNKALIASEENLEKIKKKIQIIAEEKRKHNDLLNKIKKDIDQKNITIVAKFGEGGKLFGAITNKNIVDEFDKTHGITIDKKKIHVSSEINSVGIYNVNVKLSKDIMASFDLKIVDQKG